VHRVLTGLCASAQGVSQVLGLHHQPAIGLAQQTRPFRVILLQTRHRFDALVGQQTDLDTLQLEDIDGVNQALVVARDHDQLRPHAVGHRHEIGRHLAHHGQLAIGIGRRQQAQGLIIKRGFVIVIGVAIAAQQMSVQIGLIQSVEHHTVDLCTGHRSRIATIQTAQPTQVTHVDKCDRLGTGLLTVKRSFSRRQGMDIHNKNTCRY